MNILILNGSPKGKNSTTLHTALYLQALHPEHSWEIFHAAPRLRALEKDFSPLREALGRAELILFCYPVYTFLAPYQLHRTLELIRADGIDLRGRFMSQITTSKHFYDRTAHGWLEANGFDLGLRVLRGLSADMDDLLTEKGREEAEMFYTQLMFSLRQGQTVTPPPVPPARERVLYRPCLPPQPKKPGKDVVIVTNCAPEDENLRNMTEDFRAALPYESRVVNLRDFPFAGGCLGCFSCAVSGKCVYRDGFDTFLRENIQTADAIVYAFTVSGHYTGSLFKCYDDRQFCNGHRTVTRGLATAYLISGDYRYETNLQTVIHGRCEVGGLYLAGIATDEGDTAGALARTAEALSLALEKKLRRPADFYGVGGMKIFRDLIYVMQGLMKADHKFYKENGIYDFPQRQRGRILQMKLVGGLMSIPAARKKYQGKMGEMIIRPYRKVVEAARGDSARPAE